MKRGGVCFITHLHLMTPSNDVTQTKATAQFSKSLKDMSKHISLSLQQSKPGSYVKAGFVFLLVIYIGTVTFQEILPYFNFEKESYGRFGDY